MSVGSQGSSTHKVALLGFSSVGSSVARVLFDSHPAALELTHTCNRNVEQKRTDARPSSIRWTDDFEELLGSDADIVVEVIGGLSPAEDWVWRSLAAGKNVDAAAKLALPFMITLEPCPHTQMDAALNKISKLEFVTEPPLSLSILNL